MSSSLLEKIQKTGIIKGQTLDKSEIFQVKDSIPTDIPIINIALSGRLDKGLSPGLTSIAGPSRHYKSLLGLLLMKAYFDKYPDSIAIFYDSEFGITDSYISSNGIDPSRVLHTPIHNVEELKIDLTQKLEQIQRGEKVFIFVDSIGNLSSKKESEDALNGKTVADMSRAKALKSLWRIVTPHFTTKDIPCVVVQHTYDEQGLFPKKIMSGGSGGMLSSNIVFFIGKAQEKDGSEFVGSKFTITIEKSRFVREKAKFPFIVKFDEGIEKYSGLVDIALESGIIVKPNQGFYQKTNLSTGEAEGKKYRLKETHTKEFWEDILMSKEFNNFVKKKYSLGESVKHLIKPEEEEIE